MRPQPVRKLEEIRADILALERETGGLLDEIIGGGAGSLAHGSLRYAPPPLHSIRNHPRCACVKTVIIVI